MLKVPALYHADHHQSLIPQQVPITIIPALYLGLSSVQFTLFGSMNCQNETTQTTEDRDLLYIHSKLVTSQHALYKLLVEECGKDNYNVEVSHSLSGYEALKLIITDETRRVLYKTLQRLQDAEYDT